MPTPKSGRDGQRHECKYLIPDAVARRVHAQVQPHVQPDPHAAARPDHTYPIASLYLDGDDYPLFRETREGERNRFKLRVRSYSDRPESPVFLEVKRRLNRVVQKLRCPIPRELLPAVLDGTAEPPDGTAPEKAEALRQFVRLAGLAGARPQVTVRYDRQAFVAVGDAQCRVTFDRGLRAVRCNLPEVRVDHPAMRTVECRLVVLELKYTDLCPPWMRDVVHTFDLRRISFSKYCRSVTALGASDSRVEA